jgi:hypothetical protein
VIVDEALFDAAGTGQLAQGIVLQNVLQLAFHHASYFAVRIVAEEEWPGITAQPAFVNSSEKKWENRHSAPASHRHPRLAAGTGLADLT